MKTALSQAFLGPPIAHRGLHNANEHCYENSLSAVLRAIQSGYAIEVDLQLSSDGHAMVFHDYTLDRMTARSGPINQLTATDLEQTFLADSKDTIMQLSLLLEHVSGRAPLLIELKDQSMSLGPVTGILEKAVAMALEGYEGPVAVMSFNPASVKAMATLAPNIARGLTTDAFKASEWPEVNDHRLHELRTLKDYYSTEASFISHDSEDLASQSFIGIKASGDPVLCWTVKTSEDEKTARAIADNITFENYLPDLP
jgi:glycerophosphoryl diester phosphodiesterase